jgi:hypothetical protein
LSETQIGVDRSGKTCYTIVKLEKGTKMDELKIREDEGKFYLYFNNPFGSCAYQSDPFNTLAEAEAFKQQQLDSTDLGDEE